MKKIKLLALLFTSLMAVVPPTTAISASAEENFSLGQNGIELSYNAEADGGDFGWVAVEKRFHPTSGGIPTYHKKYVIMGFDTEPKLETITRMGFYVTYKRPNFFEEIGNWWEVFWGNVPKYGTSTTDTVSVKANDTYTFLDSNNLGRIPSDKHSKYDFTAIGKINDLFEAEAQFRQDFDNYKPQNTHKYNYTALNLTGGYWWNYDSTDKLENYQKSFASREWYAVIPFDWTEEIQPESIRAKDIYGTNYDDGLDEDGEPFVDEDTGEKYIDIIVGKNAGVSINGTNAVVKKIEVRGYNDNNQTAIMIDNGDFSYEKQDIVNSANKRLFVSNETYNANWAVGNDNRYILIKYQSDNLEEAQNITIRIFYTNSNDKPAWLINVKGELGFLPPPMQTPTFNKTGNDFNKLLQLVLFAVIGILILSLLYFVLNFLLKIRDLFR